MDIYKMTIKEFAKVSEDNKLLQSSIWTKAYAMEKEIKELKAENQKLKDMMTDSQLMQIDKE